MKFKRVQACYFKKSQTYAAVCSGLFSRNSKNGTGSKRTCYYTRAAENQCEVEKKNFNKKVNFNNNSPNF